ncbi:MAG: hypothetical protein U0V87_10505 [Acidobacteriota bacterium]
MSRRNVAALALLLVAVVVYVAHAASFGVCLQDDAFITLRFSRFLAEGHGPIYNVGEYVEGYTNFSWTLLSAIPFWLGLDPPTFVLWLGYASGVGALFAAAFLACTLVPERPASAGAAALLIATLPSFVAESVMGLETAGFAALAVWAVALFVREWRDGDRFPWSGAVLAAAAWTRPEGVMIAAMLWLCDAVDAWRMRSLGPIRVRRWLTFGIPVALHLAFRVWFYRDIVPNTFHAKVGGGVAALIRGAGYTGEFFSAAWPLALVAIVGALWIGSDRQRRGNAAFMAVTIPLIYTLYVVYVGGDYKPTFRFYATPAMFLSALGGVGVDVLAEWMTRGREKLRYVATVSLVIAAGATLLMTGEPARTFAKWRADELPVHRAAGRWLKDHVASGSLLATGNAGVLPYESGLPTLDMYGLCDRHIAMRVMPRMGLGPAGHEKGDGKYVLDRQPAIILIMRARFSDKPLSLAEIEKLRFSVGESELWADTRFLRDYELISQRLPGFYFNYFKRRAS